MILIIGGRAQGKRLWAAQTFGLAETDFSSDPAAPCRALCGITDCVAEAVRAGRDPSADIIAAVERGPDLIVIADEVGCGIVPDNVFDRTWRDAAGSLTTELARRADTVVRIFCGMPTVLKGTASWS